MSPKDRERKRQVLRDHGSLYLHPERVTDELFQEVEFFDPHDLVQVKYEMLRRVRMEQWSVTRAAETFGFSRPAFYQAQAAFEQNGVVGLLPQKRGPKGAHKLSDAVLGFIATITQESSLSPPAIARRVQEHFGLSVHPRSIERAQKRRGKKRRQAL